MKVEKVAFLIKSPQDSWEGLRSTLGLLVENLWVAAFFIDAEVQLPESKSEEDFKENLEMLEDLEGEIYTNVQANVDKWGTFEYLSQEDMVAKIKDYELVVPFGG
jgi:hypothetical protein